MRSQSRVPWIWTGVIGIAALVSVVLMGGGEWAGRREAWETAAVVAVPTFLSFLGGVIATRQPGNPIAWILLATGIGVLLTSWLDALYGVEVGPPADPGSWDYFLIWVMSSTGSALVFYPLTLLLYIFPTGRFLSRRWSWTFWLAMLFITLIAVLSAFAETVGPFFADQGEVRWSIDNPIGVVPIGVVDAVVALWSLFLVVILPVGGVLSLFVRFRRSSLVVRTQIRWVLFGSLIAAISFPLGIWFLADHPLWSGGLTLVALAVIPVTITVAITRYRLFDIDRLISRTVSYTLVVVVLGLVFTAGAIWIPASLGLVDSPVLVAGSTLAVAAMFNPVRKRLLRVVDRRFNRARYEAERVFADFASGLQDATNTTSLKQQTVEVISRTVQPSSIGVWVRNG